MNAFCLWLHQEGHVAERLNLTKLRVERSILAVLDECSSAMSQLRSGSGAFSSLQF